MEQGSWIRKMFEEGASLKRHYGAENVFELGIYKPYDCKADNSTTNAGRPEQP